MAQFLAATTAAAPIMHAGDLWVQRTVPAVMGTQSAAGRDKYKVHVLALDPCHVYYHYSTNISIIDGTRDSTKAAGPTPVAALGRRPWERARSAQGSARKSRARGAAPRGPGAAPPGESVAGRIVLRTAGQAALASGFDRYLESKFRPRWRGAAAGEGAQPEPGDVAEEASGAFLAPGWGDPYAGVYGAPGGEQEEPGLLYAASLSSGLAAAKFGPGALDAEGASRDGESSLPRASVGAPGESPRPTSEGQGAQGERKRVRLSVDEPLRPSSQDGSARPPVPPSPLGLPSARDAGLPLSTALAAEPPGDSGRESRRARFAAAGPGPWADAEPSPRAAWAAPARGRVNSAAAADVGGRAAGDPARPLVSQRQSLNIETTAREAARRLGALWLDDAAPSPALQGIEEARSPVARTVSGDGSGSPGTPRMSVFGHWSGESPRLEVGRTASGADGGAQGPGVGSAVGGDQASEEGPGSPHPHLMMALVEGLSRLAKTMEGSGLPRAVQGAAAARAEHHVRGSQATSSFKLAG